MSAASAIANAITAITMAIMAAMKPALDRIDISSLPTAYDLVRRTEVKYKEDDSYESIT
jgi:hypothetical protein